MYNLRNDILDAMKNKVIGKIWNAIDGALSYPVWHHVIDESIVYSSDMFANLVIKKAKLNPNNW